MTQTAIRIRTRVLPGKRIEFTAPKLPDDGEVGLIVMMDRQDVADPPRRRCRDVAELLRSLPPIERTAEEWAAVEREIEEDRNAWNR